MLQYLNQKRGQSTLEYAVLIVVIIGALLTIQVYIKRGIQGRLKSSTDDIGDQYSPGNTNVLSSTKRHSQTAETFVAGQSNTVMTAPEQTNAATNSAIIKVDQEFWG